MKLKIFTIALIATAFFSCSNDDKEETYSPLTAEENKENLETAGINTTEKLDGLTDLSAIDALEQWNDLCNLSDPNENRDLAPIIEIIDPITKISKDAPVLASRLSQLEDLGTFYDDYEGTYTYNSDTEEWEYTESDGVIFIFPTKNSNTNNAIFSLSDFAYIESDAIGSLSSMPTAAKIKLTVDNNEIMKLTITCSYDSEGFPTKISESLNMDDYNFTTTITRSSSKATYNQSLSFEGSKIIAIELSANGDLSYDNILDNSDSDIDEQTILAAANASITIDNIQIKGILNWDEISEYLPLDSFDSEEEASTVVASLNKNARLYVKYKDSNEIFAEIEFYIDEYGEGDDIDYELDFRIKFSDGSYFDDSYFDEGFDTFADDMDTWLDNMEETYNPPK